MDYLTVTARVALPPPLLLTVMFTGLVATEERVASYLPPPLFASVPRTAPVEVVETVMVTLVLLLVASTFRVFFISSMLGLCTATVSVTGGAGGLTPRIAVLVRPAAFAVSVTGVGTVTALAAMLNPAEVAPAGIMTLAGTLAIAGLLLVRVATTPAAGAVPLRVATP